MEISFWIVVAANYLTCLFVVMNRFWTLPLPEHVRLLCLASVAL